MNRILFEKEEIDREGFATFSGERAEHVLGILHGEVGQILKTGVVDGLCGNSEIVAISGNAVTVKTSHTKESLKPWIDVLLAMPRPRVFKRMLPQLASMGVREITVVGAEKVEKAYWGVKFLEPDQAREYLVDGLMQAGTTILPKLSKCKNFKALIESGKYDSRSCKIVAHPTDRKIAISSLPSDENDLPVLAVGSEGGWTDGEVEMMEAHGFAKMSLGPRILRTDTATIALLSVLDNIANCR
jgi:RsmE family RNA methyltransferase